MNKIYDLIILGGGPAGISAGIYASQAKLETLIIEKNEFGGQIATTSNVTNYPGFDTISGKDLSEKMYKHLMSLNNVYIAHEEVTKTELDGDIKIIYTHCNCYKSYAIIASIGTTIRKLGVNNESKYLNRGLHYSSLNTKDKYKEKNVAVIGGGNSAIEDVIYLSDVCQKIYLVHRRDEFRADPLLVDSLNELVNKTHKVELILSSKPLSIEGEEKVEKLNVIHIPDNTIRSLEINGIFVSIGRGAGTDILDSKLAKDSQGYIITNEKMETNLPGVYAIGDIRNTPLRQIVTAISDGAIASIIAKRYIKQKKENKN